VVVVDKAGVFRQRELHSKGLETRVGPHQKLCSFILGNLQGDRFCFDLVDNGDRLICLQRIFVQITKMRSDRVMIHAGSV
jgi:hypothetical protein